MAATVGKWESGQSRPFWTVAFLLPFFLLAGCLRPPPAPAVAAIPREDGALSVRAAQTREFDGLEKERALRGVLFTLQDLGYVVEQADNALGFISAGRGEDSGARMTVTVEESGKERVRIRANVLANRLPVDDPNLYQSFFAALSIALFVNEHQADDRPDAPPPARDIPPMEGDRNPARDGQAKVPSPVAPPPRWHVENPFAEKKWPAGEGLYLLSRSGMDDRFLLATDPALVIVRKVEEVEEKTPSTDEGEGEKDDAAPIPVKEDDKKPTAQDSGKKDGGKKDDKKPAAQDSGKKDDGKKDDKKPAAQDSGKKDGKKPAAQDSGKKGDVAPQDDPGKVPPPSKKGSEPAPDQPPAPEGSTAKKITAPKKPIAQQPVKEPAPAFTPPTSVPLRREGKPAPPTEVEEIKRGTILGGKTGDAGNASWKPSKKPGQKPVKQPTKERPDDPLLDPSQPAKKSP